MVSIIGDLDIHSTKGERIFYRRIEEIFGGDPDTYCYYEPAIGDIRPDFVLLGRLFGIVIVEIKDYFLDRAVINSTGDWSVLENNDNDDHDDQTIKDNSAISKNTTDLQNLKDLKKIKKIRNPFDQMYSYWRTIKGRISQSTKAHPSNGLKIPIKEVVVFSNVSKKSDPAKILMALKGANINIIFKEEILSRELFIKTFLPRIFDVKLENRNFSLSDKSKDDKSQITDYNSFKKAFKINSLCSNSLNTLTKKELDLIRANLIPTCRLPRVGTKSLMDFLDYSDRIQLLDLEQEKLACELGEGHRLFYGVAGSGKTVLLVSRARYLALTHPDWNILVLCYNRVLANVLYNMIKPNDFKAHIVISNYHRFAKSTIKNASIEYSQLYETLFEQAKVENRLEQFFSEKVPFLLEKVCTENEHNDNFKFQAILIDEGQDFEESWYKSIMKMLDPKTNSLLITLDGLQGIYQRKKIIWSRIGIQAKGRVKKFRKSYRNPSIVGKIADIVLPDKLKQLILDEENEGYLKTQAYLGLSGSADLIICQGRGDEFNKICNILKIIITNPQNEKEDHGNNENNENNEDNEDNGNNFGDVVNIITEITTFDMLKSLKLPPNGKILILFLTNPFGKIRDHPLLRKMKAEGIDWENAGSLTATNSQIIVSSVHSAKGIEADIVIIPELDLYRSERDRQLLYVAITRTMHKLILTAANETPLIKNINEQNFGARKLEVYNPLEKEIKN
ncbi:MAG: ATP-binding domain-containing protein [Promethearchaeota archaeon]